MKINVAIYYDVLGASVKDPLNEVLNVMYKFYYQINSQFSEQILVTKAVYDEEHDVTVELNTYIKQNQFLW